MNLNDYLVEFIVGGSLIGLLGLWLIFTVDKKHREKKEDSHQPNAFKTPLPQIQIIMNEFKERYESHAKDLFSSVNLFLNTSTKKVESDLLYNPYGPGSEVQMVRGLTNNLVAVFYQPNNFLKLIQEQYRFDCHRAGIPIKGEEYKEVNSPDPFGIFYKIMADQGLVEVKELSQASQDFYEEFNTTNGGAFYLQPIGAVQTEPVVEEIKPTKYSELLTNAHYPRPDFTDYLIDYTIKPELFLVQWIIKEAFLAHLEKRGKILKIKEFEMEFSLSEVTMRFKLNEWETEMVSKYTNSLQEFAARAVDNFEAFFAEFLGKFEPEEGVVFMRGATVVGWIDHRDSITSSLETSEISYTFHLVNPIA